MSQRYLPTTKSCHCLTTFRPCSIISPPQRSLFTRLPSGRRYRVYDVGIFRKKKTVQRINSSTSTFIFIKLCHTEELIWLFYHLPHSLPSFEELWRSKSRRFPGEQRSWTWVSRSYLFFFSFLHLFLLFMLCFLPYLLRVSSVFFLTLWVLEIPKWTRKNFIVQVQLFSSSCVCDSKRFWKMCEARLRAPKQTKLWQSSFITSVMAQLIQKKHI